MNLPHLHLILNHVPTVGTAVAVALLLLALVRKQDGLARAGLELFCAIALVTLPAYLSGIATQPIIAELPGVSLGAIQRHHDAVIPASLVMLLAAFLAWLGLWRGRRTSGAAPRAYVLSAFALGLLTLALMGRAASIGGEIRHPEILAATSPLGAPTGALAVTIASFVNDRIWFWPALEALHFIGLWLLFGIVLVVNLRLLGMMKQASFAALHRFLPWAALGLTLNAITGMLFVIALPEQYIKNIPFYWKMGLLLVAGAQLLYLTTFDEPWHVGAGKDAPTRAKALALASIALWVGVMYFGRMLPFLGNAF
jgi:hypothetical protein